MSGLTPGIFDLGTVRWQLRQAGHPEGIDGEGTIDDPELLMSIMEARELVEETGDAKKLETMRSDNKVQQQSCIKARALPMGCIACKFASHR